MASSLSSVVSNLVRAQMGTSVTSSVTDDDLDRHVADLIVKEAKKKAELYAKTGVHAYTTNNLSDSNAPRANKRFLSSIIKSTDEHNKTVLKAQAQAAEELKRERREQEKQQRRLRAEEAAEAEKLRRGGKRKRVDADDNDGWDRWDGRTAERKKVSRNWETWDGYDDDDREKERSRRHRRSRSRDRKEENPRSKRNGDIEVVEEASSRHRRHRSRSRSPRRKRDDSRERNDEDSRRRRRRRDREDSHRHSRRSNSRSPSPSTRSAATEEHKYKKRKRSRSPTYALDDLRDESSSPKSRRRSPPKADINVEEREAELKRRLKDLRMRQEVAPSTDERSPEPGPSSSRRSLTPMTISRSPTPGPEPPINLPSKMDRYFEESYDPRLDVEPLAAPQIPATGLISDADFEGWDAMLELIRIRREDKVEKKRLERLGLLPPKEKTKTKKKDVADTSAAVADRWGAEGVNVMDIEYSKKGTVREWDMGKAGF